MTTEGSSDRLSSRPEQSPQGGITERRNEPRPSTCADLRVIPEVKSSDRCFDMQADRPEIMGSSFANRWRLRLLSRLTGHVRRALRLSL
jgi:hypothetical protein